MKTKPSNALIAVALILSIMLFSSLECNKPDDGECGAGIVENSYCVINAPVLIKLDPPTVTWNTNGPTDICSSDHIEVASDVRFKKAPPNTISLVCTVSWLLFYEHPINLDKWETTPVPNYSSDWVDIGLGAFDKDEPGWVNYRMQATWNPVTPYSTQEELMAFVNEHFDKITIECDYKVFKP